MKKNLFMMLLCAALALSLFAAGALTALAQEPDVQAEGRCGDHAAWMLTADGTLYVFGYGELNQNSPSWKDNSSEFKQSVNAVTFVNVIPPEEYELWETVFSTEDLQLIIQYLQEHPEVGITSIPSNAFDGFSNLASVALPGSLTAIGSYAFNGCDSLPLLTLPDGVTDIDSLAFAGYGGRLYATLGSDTAYAISDASNSLYFCVPGNGDVKQKYVRETRDNEEVTVLKAAVFDSAQNTITSATIPAGVQAIMAYGFSGCALLESVVLPEGLTTLENNAFSNCAALSSVTLPTSLKTIRNSAFYGCTALTSLDFPDGVTTVENAGYGAFPTGIRLYATVGSDTARALSASAYYFYVTGNENVRLQYVTINNSELTERLAAKAHDSTITFAVIPTGVTEIGYQGFGGCADLASVEMANTVTSIEGNAFNGCASLESMNLPTGLTAIEHYAFGNCAALASLTFPDGVTSVDSTAFSSCPARLYAAIGSDAAKALSSNGNYYFCVAGNENVKLRHTLSNGQITGLKAKAYNDAITSAVIPAGVTEIAASGFYQCAALQSVTLSEGVTGIGGSAFRYCEALAEVDLPESLRTIGGYAFGNCPALTTLTFPDGVTSVDSTAFSSCPARLYAAIGSDAAKALSKNFYFHVTGNENVKLRHTLSNGEITGLKAKAYDTGITSAVIPAGVTEIESNGFYQCAALQSVVLSEGVTGIGGSAFRYCETLTEVTLPESLRTIGGYAFGNCPALTALTFPDGVTSVDSTAFSSCSARLYAAIGSDTAKALSKNFYFHVTGNENVKLRYTLSNEEITGLKAKTYDTAVTAAVIPAGVTEIESSAFYQCAALQSVEIADSVTVIGARAFDGCAALTDVYYAGYRAQWKAITKGANNTALDSAVMHYGKNDLPDLILPDSLTEIGEEAFAGGAFTCARLSEQTVVIGKNAFADCPNLVSVYIPAETAVIDPLAFGEREDLTIYGKADSTAQTFANAHHMTFVEIE